MLPKGLLRADNVATVLQVDLTTLLYWQERDFLVPVTGYSQKYYEDTTVDEWLRAQSRNFPSPPRFQDLVSGRIELLQPEVAAKRLGVTTSWLSTLVETRRLAAVKLMREYRYDEASIAARIASKNDTENVPYLTVEHILGISRPTLRRLIVEGKLTKALGDPYKGRVTRESLVLLLSDLLLIEQDEGKPLRFVDPADWIDDRLATIRPLLSLPSVAHHSHDRPRVMQLVRNGELLAVRHAISGRPLISPDAVLAYIERTENALNSIEIAHIFNVTPPTVSKWQSRGRLICVVHEHYDKALYKSCIIEILREWLTQGSSPLQWYRSRIERPEGVVGIEYAERLLKTDQAGVLQLIEAGDLYGLRLPGGEWRFLVQAVHRTRRARNEKRKTRQ